MGGVANPHHHRQQNTQCDVGADRVSASNGTDVAWLKQELDGLRTRCATAIMKQRENEDETIDLRRGTEQMLAQLRETEQDREYYRQKCGRASQRLLEVEEENAALNQQLQGRQKREQELIVELGALSQQHNASRVKPKECD